VRFIFNSPIFVAWFLTELTKKPRFWGKECDFLKNFPGFQKKGPQSRVRKGFRAAASLFGGLRAGPPGTGGESQRFDPSHPRAGTPPKAGRSALSPLSQILPETRHRALHQPHETVLGESHGGRDLDHRFIVDVAPPQSFLLVWGKCAMARANRADSSLRTTCWLGDVWRAA
jgi:hypothetical protein